MFYSSGLEVSAGLILSGEAIVAHSVSADGTAEIQFGGHTGLHLLLDEDAVCKLHATTGAAIEEIDAANGRRNRKK